MTNEKASMLTTELSATLCKDGGIFTYIFLWTVYRDIANGSMFAIKPLVKLLKSSRIVNDENGLPSLFHSHVLRLVDG